MNYNFDDKKPDNTLKRGNPGGDNRNPRGRPPEGGPEFNWQKTLKTLAFWAVIILLSFWAFNYYFGAGHDSVEISYSELQSQVVSGNVTKVTFEERRVLGEFRSEFTKRVG